MSIRKCARQWFLVLICTCLGGGVDAEGRDEAHCARSGIQVPGWTATERARVCAAAEIALDFLRRAGFAYDNGLTIRPAADTSEPTAGSEVGHFNVKRNEVQIVPLEGAGQERVRSAFGLPMTPTLWESYISHEVAHAIAKQQFAPRVRRFTASEHIAGVVQLATMQPALRKTILDRHADVEPYRTADEISSLYHLMAPGQFAVKVYRHYLRLSDAGPASAARTLATARRELI